MSGRVELSPFAEGLWEFFDLPAAYGEEGRLSWRWR
jgi:hypothetical protein